MEINESMALALSIKYAKKFGFISKSFFWDHFCKKSKTNNFRYWNAFLNCGAFVPYKELQGGAEEYYHLNLKSVLVNKDSIEPVGKRTPLYLYHDEQVMRFIYSLESQNLIKTFWTELELRSNQLTSYKILGGNTSKIPDLVFDLNCPSEIFRSALEVEITRKSNDRYFKSFLNYSSLSNLDFVLYGTSHERTHLAIKSEASKGYFGGLSKKLGFYSISDFQSKSASCDLEFNSRKIPIENFFKNIIALKAEKNEKTREKDGTRVPSHLIKNEGSL
ncbi:MAG: hypothetical protein JNL11_14915 [Bdellovibrionaceae bacterium]|nr:hypothetical protein [Pseudobdellovibrionaceae bacterium]